MNQWLKNPWKSNLTNTPQNPPKNKPYLPPLLEKFLKTMNYICYHGNISLGAPYKYCAWVFIVKIAVQALAQVSRQAFCLIIHFYKVFTCSLVCSRVRDSASLFFLSLSSSCFLLSTILSAISSSAKVNDLQYAIRQLRDGHICYFFHRTTNSWVPKASFNYDSIMYP